ncbi:unnamed protein product [Closterium sp. NIES-53]
MWVLLLETLVVDISGSRVGRRLSQQQLHEWAVRLGSSGGEAVGDGAGGAGVGGAGAGGTGAGASCSGGIGAHQQESLSPQQLRKWTIGWGSSGGGAGGAGGTSAGGAGAGGARGTAAAGSGGAGAGGAGGAGGAVPGAHRELVSRSALPVRTVRCARRVRPPPVPGTHTMALRPSSLPQCVPLSSPLASSLHDVPDPESDLARAASPTVMRVLATLVTEPSFESTAASVLVTKLVDFVAIHRLDYCASLVTEYKSQCLLSVGGELALGSDVLEDRQFELKCLVFIVPHLASMQLCPEGDPDAVVPPPGANIVYGMWIFRRQGVNFFQTFFPTAKMTTLWVLLHVTAQRDYELHSLDFSTAFFQGSRHEEIWLRCPPGFTAHLASLAFGFAPSTADPSPFLRTQPYILVYVNEFVLATTDTEALALVKVEMQKRHTCTNLGELRSYLGLQITWDRARHTITLTQSHMVHQVSC